MTSVSGQESSCYLPEESVMLNADLPQLLGGFVVRQLEANCALILLLLWRKKESNTIATNFYCVDKIVLFCFLNDVSRFRRIIINK